MTSNESLIENDLQHNDNIFSGIIVAQSFQNKCCSIFHYFLCGDGVRNIPFVYVIRHIVDVDVDCVHPNAVDAFYCIIWMESEKLMLQNVIE